VARLAAARGHDLLLTWGSDAAAAEATAAACRAAGAAVELVQADAADPAATARAFAALDARFGRLDAFVGNAGITGPASDFLSSSDETWSRVFAVNVLGLVTACRVAARRMARSRGGQGGGIVCVSSRAPAFGSPFEFVHYAASKGAVDVLVRGLAKELAGEGLRVNAVAPGDILTPANANIVAEVKQAGASGRYLRTTPLGRRGSPAEIGEAVAFLLSDRSSFTTGATLTVDGGLLAY
jgi:NAD(P)-dependent dehydrogenase (short-subunit alcohol dehydrogenase family)